MNPAQARILNQQLWGLVEAGQLNEAMLILAPLLEQAIPFRVLDLLAKSPAGLSWELLDPFLEKIAEKRAMGSWVIIASAIAGQLDKDLSACLERARHYAITSDVWYAVDSLGERVTGPALVRFFESTLALLQPWRSDLNPWVRRQTGVAVHLWAKRNRGRSESFASAEALLEFLSPLFEERRVEAVKGIGWGLKTLGRYYPEQVIAWLNEQVIMQGRSPQALMLRKAMTYLPVKKLSP